MKSLNSSNIVFPPGAHPIVYRSNTLEPPMPAIYGAGGAGGGSGSVNSINSIYLGGL